ncbi:hypothetical protein MTR_1g033590 [Medicago truncatula]|uniref:Uncharacterized protein n=1 Tax=Medicago truncatula TaxID=3880 RepID=A0A072VF93_MEDTR|nr:hypothetical protein MTR_1g033590 [Medicago truncatula]
MKILLKCKFHSASAQRSADGSIWSHPTTALLQIGQVVVEKATTQVANTTGICSNPLISDR